MTEHEKNDAEAMAAAGAIISLAERAIAAMKCGDAESAAKLGNCLFGAAEAMETLGCKPDRPAQALAFEAAHRAARDALAVAEARYRKVHGKAPPSPPPGWRP